MDILSRIFNEDYIDDSDPKYDKTPPYIVFVWTDESGQRRVFRIIQGKKLKAYEMGISFDNRIHMMARPHDTMTHMLSTTLDGYIPEFPSPEDICRAFNNHFRAMTLEVLRNKVAELAS